VLDKQIDLALITVPYMTTRNPLRLAYSQGEVKIGTRGTGSTKGRAKATEVAL